VLPAGENAKLARVPWVGPPLCLELVHGTRVCAVRVDTAVEVETKILPQLARLSPGFSRDIMVLNVG
jgi:hypothetical protein